MTVHLLGVPWDEESSFLRGSAAGPAACRAALASPSSNMFSECGLDLGRADALVDAGDVVLPDAPPAAVAEAISAHALRLLHDGAAVLSIGGDHAVTYPLVRAHAQRFGRLHILHLDAHPDLYDHFEGDRYSHACPFARVMEEGLAARLVQVGIRTLNDTQRPQVARFGVEQIDMRAWDGAAAVAGRLVFDGPVYLSLDLDVLDPAFAPGVSHHEPGGVSVRDVLTLIQRFEGQLVGADIVELNPDRDFSGVTAAAAAKCLKELAARLLRDGR